MTQPGHDVSETLRAANLALVRSLDLDSVLKTLLAATVTASAACHSSTPHLYPLPT